VCRREEERLQRASRPRKKKSQLTFLLPQESEAQRINTFSCPPGAKTKTATATMTTEPYRYAYKGLLAMKIWEGSLMNAAFPVVYFCVRRRAGRPAPRAAP